MMMTCLILPLAEEPRARVIAPICGTCAGPESAAGGIFAAGSVGVVPARLPFPLQAERKSASAASPSGQLQRMRDLLWNSRVIKQPYASANGESPGATMTSIIFPAAAAVDAPARQTSFGSTCPLRYR